MSTQESKGEHYLSMGKSDNDREFWAACSCGWIGKVYPRAGLAKLEMDEHKMLADRKAL